MIAKIVGLILAILIVFEFYCVFAAEEGSPPQSPPSAAGQESSSAPLPPSKNVAPDSGPESKNEQKNKEPASKERLRAEIFQMVATPILTAITVLLSVVFYFSKAKKDQSNLIDQLRVTSRNAIVAAFASDPGFRNAIEGILKANSYELVKVTAQVVKTRITLQLATLDHLRAAETEPLRPARRLHMRR
jgi:hypothetical protein